jgi:hypothetical protein
MMRPVLIVSVAVATALVCCKNSPAVLSADNVAIDLTDTVCAPLENQTAGQPWVDFVCTLAEGVEDVIASVETPTTDAGSATATTVTTLKGVKTIKVRVPAAEAASFMSAHRVAIAKR